MKKMSFIKIATLTLAILTSFASCEKEKKPVEEKETEKVSFAVNTYIIKEGQLDDYLEFGGDIVSSSLVNIMPDTNGKISKLVVKVGELVKKDQIIAYVDPSRPGMTYSASPVKAPASGTITLLPATIGQMVGTSTSIGQISNTDKLEIHTNIAERFVSRIKNGQSATISFDAYPGEVFEATVFEVSPVLDTTTRTMKVKLRLNSIDPRIKVGMYSRIKLVTEKINNAIIMPFDAIVTRNKQPFVFIVNRETSSNDENTLGTVSLKKVSQGIHVDDKVEITEGLKIGDEIVTRGQTVLTDGSFVNIIETSNND